MKTIGIISTTALALLIGVAAPSYAQDDHDQKPEQKQEQKDKPADKKASEDKNAKQEEKNTQQEDRNKQQEQKNAQQQDRNTKQEEKSAQQQDKNNQQEQKNAQQTQRAANNNHGGRIPADRYQANFGRQHSFHVSQSDYSRDRRFEYGGYSFGFVDAWPSNWLYTEDVYVIEIDGVYYLCNASYPGVNVALSINL